MDYASNKFKELGQVFVHRDIKPANILITYDKVAKITDFGIAKIYEEDTESFKQEGGNVQSDKTVAGLTPAYASPEQWMGLKDIDIRSDIYSFGVVLYEILTNEKPFEGPYSYNYQAQHLKVQPSQPKDKVEDIPNELNNLVLKCLKKDRKERYNTFKELIEELRKIYKGKYNEEYKIETTKIELEAWEIVNKGAALSNIGKNKEAIIHYDKAIKINPNLEVAWFNKGVALSDIGMKEEAIKYYDKAIEINHNYVEAWYNKGLALIALDKKEEAIKCFDRAIEINPNYYQAWSDKGGALFDLDKKEEAIKHFDRAIEINSNYAYAWYNKGNVLYASEKFEEAIKCYDKAIEINQDYAIAWSNKGIALGNLGIYQEAINCFDSALKINPNLDLAWYYKGFMSGCLGLEKEAINCVETALKINPELRKDLPPTILALLK